ncbi:hemin uptake protein HemP [Rhodoferax ferrireducens]|uniref:hemin uptake protein HemP n=1 Tax=Rhodoferax ferrireducens TaxID=192843 RepID=UPI000E0D74AD|nr:hemin uptake protein HemP [Rhodoferax ferrireducens]
MQATDQVPQRLPLPVRPSLRRPSGDSLEPVRSTDLLKGQKSVVIEHNGSIYRLQATKLGKLILTK